MITEIENGTEVQQEGAPLTSTKRAFYRTFSLIELALTPVMFPSQIKKFRAKIRRIFVRNGVDPLADPYDSNAVLSSPDEVLQHILNLMSMVIDNGRRYYALKAELISVFEQERAEL